MTKGLKVWVDESCNIQILHGFSYTSAPIFLFTNPIICKEINCLNSNARNIKTYLLTNIYEPYRHNEFKGPFMTMCCRFELNGTKWTPTYNRTNILFIPAERIHYIGSYTILLLHNYYITSLYYKAITICKTFDNKNHPHAKDCAINYILRIK